MYIIHMQQTFPEGLLLLGAFQYNFSFNPYKNWKGGLFWSYKDMKNSGWWDEGPKVTQQPTAEIPTQLRS